MIRLPVYLSVGTAGRAWLGDVEVEDAAPDTIAEALPPFLRDVAASVSGVGLDAEQD